VPVDGGSPPAAAAGGGQIEGGTGSFWPAVVIMLHLTLVSPN
jgi:hypothetical protein